MKGENINYSKKCNHLCVEAVNAGKEIEAMKCLMLHRIASLLYCFIASGAQLWRREAFSLITFFLTFLNAKYEIRQTMLKLKKSLFSI
jgi:hypothetical protein